MRFRSLRELHREDPASSTSPTRGSPATTTASGSTSAGQESASPAFPADRPPPTPGPGPPSSSLPPRSLPPHPPSSTGPCLNTTVHGEPFFRPLLVLGQTRAYDSQRFNCTCRVPGRGGGQGREGRVSSCGRSVRCLRGGAMGKGKLRRGW